MTETQKRIKAYKAALPGLRERVLAVALLLAMSMAMMTSASFAWLTISRRPEVSGVNTTIAANGNLEIALATGDGTTAPGDSKVGDSSATKGQSITASNLTWGNLVNLGDPAYGLDHLTLRPAQLNTSALLTSPLYGAVYSADGRVQKLTSNFGYTAWVPAQGDVEAYFGLTNDVGVRAISSLKAEVTGYAGAVRTQADEASSANALAAGTFTGILSDSEKMNVLAKVLGIHMTASLNTEDKYVNATITQEELRVLIDMYQALLDAHKQEADAIAKTLNLQLYVGNGGLTEYTPYTMESVLAISQNDSRIYTGADQELDADDNLFNQKTATLSSGDFYIQLENGRPVIVKDLKTFLKDYKMLQTDIATLNTILESGDYRWKDGGLRTVINKLMDVDSCLVKKQTESQFKTVEELMKQFSDNIFDALGYMGAKCDIIITNGVLYNLEQRLGTSIKVENMKVTAKMYVNTANLGEQTADIYAYVTTAAEQPYHFFTDLNHHEAINNGPSSTAAPAMLADTQSGDESDPTTSAAPEAGSVTVMAQDTYALAVDFWVRTNNQASFLVLEGNILTESEERYVTGKDADGNTVDIYTLDRSTTVPAETNADGSAVEGSEQQTVVTTYELYQGEKTENGTTTTVWYRADTYSEFALEDGESPMQKVETVQVVVGYEGENRVWDTSGDKNYIGTTATTQGSGSCYVYYADTPEDQARSLELLKAMKVAFVDAEGSLLTIAEMDTEHFFAESGRVIVPLKLGSESLVIGTDEQGEAIYGITLLQKNVPTRITAIVYLDGAMLDNQNVLAAADIQGKLNIQFGTSGILTPIENEPLENATRSVSATASVTSFDYDTHQGEMRTTVTVRVDGEQPNQVKAFFLRQINSTQGSREGEMTFTYDQANNIWTADYVFTSPGKYIMRTVQLDGQEYELGLGLEDPASARPTVNITGFAVASLSCAQANEQRAINLMSADNSSTVDLTLKFATDDPTKLPSTVQGRFLRQDGTAVNVNFTYNPTSDLWTGSAAFLASGDYDFQFLVLNGKYVELDQNMWLTASVSLGMRVAVFTTSPSSFQFVPEEMEANEKTLAMQVKIMDNSGETLPGLTGATLSYRLNTSKVKTMDTNLTWDPVSGYYLGYLKTLEMNQEGDTVLHGDYGIWIFNNVTMGNNVISSATTSPNFAMMPPDPPSYHSFHPELVQYSPIGSNRAKLNAYINYSSAAEIWAVVETADGSFSQLVKGELTSYTKDSAHQWFFRIPQRGSQDALSQQGEWVLKELHVWGYMDENGNTIENKSETGTPNLNSTHLTIDLTEYAITTRVIQDVQVSFPNAEGNANLNEELLLQGENFMHTYSFSGINMNFTAAGTDLSLEELGIAVGSVTLQYAYDGNTKDHGHYEITSTQDAKAQATDNAFVLNFNADGYTGEAGQRNIGSSFTQSAAQSVTYAGNYTPYLLSYKVYDASSGNELTTNFITVDQTKLPGTDSGILKVTVESEKPILKVTDVSPGVNEPFATTRVVGGVHVQITGVRNYISESGNYAVVYMKGASSYGNWYYTMPSVTLTLEGLSKGTTSLTMVNEQDPNTKHVFDFPEGTTSTNAQGDIVTISTATQTVGRSASNTIGSETKFLAGSTTFTELLVLYDGMEFTVTLSEPVTIEQPEAPNVLSFGNIPEAATNETKPESITVNGSQVRVYLPRLTWEDVTVANATNKNYSSWTSETKRTDYSINNINLGIVKRVRYQYFYWTRYSRTYDSVGNATVQNMVIESYTINGEQYEAGKWHDIEITGDTVAIANQSKDGEPFNRTGATTPMEEVRYGYVAGPNEQTSTPAGGYSIGERWGSYPQPTKYSESDSSTYTSTEGDYERFWP